MHVSDDITVQHTQCPVDFDIVKIPFRREADKLIGANQAAEPALIGTACGHAVSLVDDQAG